jgi:hypothetical protein
VHPQLLAPPEPPDPLLELSSPQAIGTSIEMTTAMTLE